MKLELLSTFNSKQQNAIKPGHKHFLSSLLLSSVVPVRFYVDVGSKKRKGYSATASDFLVKANRAGNKGERKIIRREMTDDSRHAYSLDRPIFLLPWTAAGQILALFFATFCLQALFMWASHDF